MSSFEMFTAEGDALVTDMVKLAKTHRLEPNVVMGLMDALSKQSHYSEITDTAVRECVGIQLGWYK